MAKHEITWVDPIVPDEDDRCRYLRYKFENGQMLRQIDVRDSGGVLLYTLAFQEEEDVTPQVGDEALRIDYTDINSTQKSITCTVVTVTQEMIDGTISPTNLAPTDIALSNATIPESTGIGDTVGTLSTFDPNVGDTHTYTILSDPDNKFDLSGDLLRLKNLVDYNTATSHTVTIRTTDQGLLFYDKQFTIVITQVTEFLNDKATLFQGDTLNTYMSGKTTESVLPGQGSFVASCWIKKDNPSGIPSDIADLDLWLDADDVSTIIETGGSISQWNDKSGNNNNLIAPLTANEPTLIPNGFGSRNTVSFDGIANYLTTNLSTVKNEITITVVMKFNQLTQPLNDYDYVYSHGSYSANNMISMSRNSTGVDNYYLFDGGIQLQGPVLQGQVFKTFTQRINTSSVYHELFIDGTPQIVDDNDTNFTLTGTFDLGKFLAGAHYFNGEIAEIIVYNRAINDTERQSLENILDQKWNQGNSSTFKTLFSLKQSAISGKLKAELQWNESNNLRALLYDTVSDSVKTIEAVGNWGDNQYHLVNIRHDSIGGSTTICVDDNVLAVTPCVIAASGDGLMTLASFEGTSPFYDGLMDEVSLWNNAVSIAEIYSGGYASDLTLHSGAASLLGWWRMGDPPDDFLLTDGIIDRSGNGNHLTAHTMTSSNCVNDSVPPFLTYNNTSSLPANGIDQYGDTGLGTDFLANDFSVSLWYKGTSPNYILSQADSLAPASSQWIIAQGGGSFLFWFNSVTMGNISLINDNNWHHIGFSWNSTTNKYKGYVDGTLLGESAMVTPNTAAANIYLNTNEQLSTFSQGNTDEISFWNKSLTDAEFTELYNLGVPTNLDTHSAVGNRTNWWRMGETTGDNETTVKDVNGNSDITLFNYLANPYDPDTST